jgi:acyl-CoA thioester hydrolase
MAAEFPFDIELSVRYRDLDTLEHVNNAVYGTYLEQARLEYFKTVLGIPFEEWEMVLAGIEMDFSRPIVLDDESVRIECGVTDIGESSFRMGYRVYAGGSDEPSATGETTLVVVDERGTKPVPPAWQESFQEFEPGL